MSRFISVTSSAIDFRQLRKSKAQQSSPLKRIPSSKRGNNILWHVWQNGQTAIEQPAQTQVEHVYRQLSGRRGVRVLCSHSGSISKSKHRMKLRLVRTGARREFRSVTGFEYKHERYISEAKALLTHFHTYINSFWHAHHIQCLLTSFSHGSKTKK